MHHNILAVLSLAAALTAQTVSIRNDSKIP
jgi:hypothetical protein